MRIQQYPFGFLATLNAKSTGETPTETEQRLRLSMEMLPYYLASIPIQSAGSSNAAASVAGNSTNVQIPQGEAWQVIAAKASIVGGTAGQPGSVGFSIGPPDGSNACVVAYQPPLTIIAATQVIEAPWGAPAPVIFGPGTLFYGVLEASTTALTLSVRVLYRALKV